MSTSSDPRERVLDRWHGLLFDIRRSRRYHLRREQSFGRLHFVAGFLTALTASATFAAVLADLPAGPWLAALTAAFGAVGLAGQPLSRALAHRDLTRAFTRLEKDLRRPESEITEAELHRLQIRRLEIEEREPPTIQVINVSCHNEEVVAGGYGAEHLARVRWHHRVLASLFDLWPHSLHKAAPRG